MKTTLSERDYAYGAVILTLRTKIGLTQAELADRLGIKRLAIGKWEAGSAYPKPEHLKALIAQAVKSQAFTTGHEAEEIRVLWKAAQQRVLLDEHWLSELLSGQRDPLPHMVEASVEETKSLIPVRVCPASEPEEHTGHETETHAPTSAVDQDIPVRHNLPFPPNPFFTGRETELLLISQLFEKNERIAITQPISISGLGGIGKTQLALEYAHRYYPNLYRRVLWVNAADKASLEASYLTLAHLLKLPSDNAREIDRIVEAIKIWLEEHSRWLLILDNADNLELACSYLPTRPRGHILLTTRSQIVGGVAALIQVETMSREEGLLFLLRRSGVLKSGAQAERIASDICCEAEALVEMFAGHPLALDQAGAYIEETGEASAKASEACFIEYRQLYQQESRCLLKRRGFLGREHPESVATTFEISLKKASELHPICADILAFCSLLHPDAIPEELLCQESGLNLDVHLFNEAISALRRYSLVKHDREKKVLFVHRLVQAVSREAMQSQTLRQWTELVVRALNTAFPEAEFPQWCKCEQLLPHVLICAIWIEGEAIAPVEAAHLLRKAGNYLRVRGLYTDAGPLTLQALSICEQYLGASHPDTAKILNSLAIIYKEQGEYEQAEPLYQRALVIREQHLGTSHPATAISLNNLANLYREQGKYEQAEPLHQRALSIQEQHLGVEHPDTAQSQNNLANLYREQGKYEQAESLLKLALSIREQHLGAQHPDTAQCLNNLAILYWYQGTYEQAESLYQRALAIREQHLGTEHPDIAQCLNNLAIIYKEQGKYEQAEPLYQRALSIWERYLGTEHPRTAACLNNLAELYRLQGKYEQAEPMYQRALSIWEHRLGAEHPYMAETLHELAELYQQQGKYEQAEPLYQRALHIREQRLGPTHPETEKTRRTYAAFLCLLECDASATVLDAGDQSLTEGDEKCNNKRKTLLDKM